MSGWQNFLRPTKSKILAFALLLLLLPFPLAFRVDCDPSPCPPDMLLGVEAYNGVRVIWDIIHSLNPIGYTGLMFHYLTYSWFTVLPTLILEYLIACMIFRRT
jgi:hypothetical protein